MVDDGEQVASNPLVDAAEAAFRRAAADHVATATAAKDASLTNWLEAFEGEHAAVLRSVLSDVLAHPDMPPVVAEVVGAIANPEHQTQALLGMAAVYAIVSGFVSAAIQPELQDVANVAWHENPTMPLSPQDMALAVIRGESEHDVALNEAMRSGMDANRFELLLANTGDTLGLAQLLEAFRRGIIDEGTLAHGVRQSRYKSEWLDTIIALRYSPVPVGEILDAWVQGHLSDGEAQKRISFAGLNPDDSDWLYETHGRPPGTGELEQLVNRGELSVAALEQAVRESNIKNKYIPALVALRRKIPPMRTIVAAIHQGVLSPADATERLMDLGYNAVDAAMFVKEGQALKHTTNKQLSQSMIHTAYAERLITEPQAASMLGDLGYDTTEVAFILSIADHQRHVAAQKTAINRVHSRYIAFRIDRTAASSALDKIGVDPAGRDDLLGTWDDERAANTPILSLAQLDGLAKRHLITQGVYQEHVLALGYPKNYVPLLYALAFPATADVPKWAP